MSVSLNKQPFSPLVPTLLIQETKPAFSIAGYLKLREWLQTSCAHRIDRQMWKDLI